MKLFVALLAFLLVGLASASPLPDKPHVYVEGSAKIEVVPDKMEFSVVLSKAAPELAEAKKDVDRRSRELIAVLKKAGIAEKNIATTTLSVSPHTEYKDGKRVPAGTSVSRQVDITLDDLNLYAGVMAALVDADIARTIDTRLVVSSQRKLEDRVQQEAMKDARARAERLAQSQGKKLGEPYSISEFNTRLGERYMLHPARGIEGKSSSKVAGMVAEPSPEPFEPGVMVARAQVYVVYLLK